MPKLTITRVVREESELNMSRAGSKSIGEYVDHRIASALSDGQELSTIHIDILKEDWEYLVENMYGTR